MLCFAFTPPTRHADLLFTPFEPLSPHAATPFERRHAATISRAASCHDARAEVLFC